MLKEDELPAIDTELEDYRHCIICGSRNHDIVKVIESLDNVTGQTFKLKSDNHAYPCSNPDCHRYFNLEKVPSWELAKN